MPEAIWWLSTPEITVAQVVVLYLYMFRRAVDCRSPWSLRLSIQLLPRSTENHWSNIDNWHLKKSHRWYNADLENLSPIIIVQSRRCRSRNKLAPKHTIHSKSDEAKPEYNIYRKTFSVTYFINTPRVKLFDDKNQNHNATNQNEFFPHRRWNVSWHAIAHVWE